MAALGGPALWLRPLGARPADGAPRGLSAACSARLSRADLDGAHTWRSMRTPPVSVYAPGRH